MERRQYDLQLNVNGHRIEKVIIDPHYEKKHKSSLNDKLILELVKDLDGGRFPAVGKDGPYEYFATDNIFHNGKRYKLIWLMEDNALYIGVINAYRRK